MSELKVIKIELNNHGKPIASIQGTTSYYGISPNDTFYPQAEADKVIADKDAEIARLKAICKVHIEAIESMCEGLKLNAKQICKTQRALWLARANRVLEKIAWFKLWNASISTMNPEDGARQEYDKWKKNLGKFLAKAEEYK